jgi:hypothetical protein
MNAPTTPRLRSPDDRLIDVRLACARIGVLGSEPQPDCAEIQRTCEGLRRLLSEPVENPREVPR